MISLLTYNFEKMSETLLMCSTMITPTTRRTMSTVLVVLLVPVPRVLPLPSSPLTVSAIPFLEQQQLVLTFLPLDSKQARDLITILTEAKQQVDPRLAEMVRYGGGGGGGRWGGRGGGRGRGGWGGGRGGGGGGGFTASNSAPVGGNRRW
jgi:uncharacterized membrane protein YgcG